MKTQPSFLSSKSSNGRKLPARKMRGQSSTSLLTILMLVTLAVAPTLYSMPLVTHGNSSPIVANFANSLTMPLPAIPLPSTSQLSPVSGVLRVLVIAAAFADMNTTKSTAELKQDFFGTVGDFYKEISYGTVSLQGDVVGWYMMNQSMIYYGRDCTNVDDADCSGSPTSWWLARDAVAAANKDPNVRFSNYDYFVVIHTGVGEESSKNKDDVWSVAYLSGIWLRTKDKSISSFAILPEMEALGAVPIGVYAHEFGHLIGLPDLYNTQTGKTVMGYWSLMDKGLWNGEPPGSSPSHMEAWSKIRLGWINGSMLAVANDGAVVNYTIDPTEVASSNVHAVKIPVSTSSPVNQYYLVEVRAHIGFDQGLPNVGVLITYVDEKAFQNKVKVIDGHPSIPGLADATWDSGQIFIDEKNNIMVAINSQAGDSYQITVNRLGPIADLAVSKIFTQPTDIKPNANVTIYIVIVNLGTASATSVPVQIYLDGQPFANQQVTLNPGQTTEIALKWTAVPGSHTVRVLIDPYDVLNELNKANDQSTYTLNVGPTLIITVPLNVTSGNVTAWVKVNGQLYNTTGSQLKTSVVAGMVSIEIEPFVLTSNSSRQGFAGWSDGSTQNPRLMNVTTDTSLTARYKTQYLLNVDRSGGLTTPGGWYDANSQIVVSATSPSNVTEQASRMLFTYWSGDVFSNSTTFSFNMTKPTSLKANWKTQYYLNVISSVGSPSGAGWYDQGATATVAVQSPVMVENNTRQVFTGWNGTSSQDTTKTITVNAPTILQAAWKTQYYVQIQSAYGNPQGSGWYDAGTQLPISVQPEINHSNRTRRVFAGWSGDYTGTTTTFTMPVNGPKSLTASWITQYQLSFRVIGLPNSTFIKLNINNATHDLSIASPYTEWFSQGAQIDPTANQTLVNGFLQFQLNGFYNSTGGKVEPPITVSQPMDYTIAYQQAFPLLAVPGFPIESILTGLIIGFLSMALLRRRRIQER